MNSDKFNRLAAAASFGGIAIASISAIFTGLQWYETHSSTAEMKRQISALEKIASESSSQSALAKVQMRGLQIVYLEPKIVDKNVQSKLRLSSSGPPIVLDKVLYKGAYLAVPDGGTSVDMPKDIDWLVYDGPIPISSARHLEIRPIIPLPDRKEISNDTALLIYFHAVYRDAIGEMHNAYLCTYMRINQKPLLTRPCASPSDD